MTYNNNAQQDKIRSRKLKKIQKVVTRLLVIVTILIIMGGMSYNVVGFGGQLVVTQAQLVHYYTEIRDAESERDYNEDMASMYPHIPTYRNSADEADERIRTYTEARKELQHSSDPVVAFAARNGFDVPTVVLGIACNVSVLLAWFGVFFLYRRFRKQLETAMSYVMYCVLLLFVVLLELLSAAANAIAHAVVQAFRRPKRNKKRSKRSQHDAQRQNDQDNVVPFRRRIG